MHDSQNSQANTKHVKNGRKPSKHITLVLSPDSLSCVIFYPSYSISEYPGTFTVFLAANRTKKQGRKQITPVHNFIRPHLRRRHGRLVAAELVASQAGRGGSESLAAVLAELFPPSCFVPCIATSGMKAPRLVHHQPSPRARLADNLFYVAIIAAVGEGLWRPARCGFRPASMVCCDVATAR